MVSSIATCCATCRRASLQGATALHLAALRMGELMPRDAADTVHSLITSATHLMHVRAAPCCEPIGMASATPLEAACMSTQLAHGAIDALMLKGARLEGADGARALLVCLTARCRKKARLLLQRQVRRACRLPYPVGNTCCVRCTSRFVRGACFVHCRRLRSSTRRPACTRSGIAHAPAAAAAAAHVCHMYRSA